MNNALIHFISSFVPTKRLRRRVREKLKQYGIFCLFCKNVYIFKYTKVVFGKKRYNISGNNNKVIVNNRVISINDICNVLVDIYVKKDTINNVNRIPLMGIHVPYLFWISFFNHAANSESDLLIKCYK